MSSGFTGGGGNGGSDYFSAVGNHTGGGGTGRSASSLSNMINSTTTNTNNNIFQQNPYRSLIAGAGSVFPDHLSHLHRGNNQQQLRGLIGKRTLAEFQTHQQQNQNQNQLHQQQQHNSFSAPQNLYQQQQNKELLSMYLRSVKPRIQQNTSPISPLSPIDLLNELPSRRYGLAQLNHQQQLLRSQQQIASFGNNNNNSSYQNFSIPNLVAQQPQQQQQQQQQQQFTVEQQQITVQKAVTESEAYQLVEKELFEEDVDDYTQHFDEESIITATTGWDELLAPSNEKANNNPISPSSSSTCSSTVPITSMSPPMGSKQSLTEIAAALLEGRSEHAAEILTRVMNQPGFVNRQGTAEQKSLFYITAALRSRLNVSPIAAERSDFSSANQLLNQNSSCFKLGLMAANLSIIEATADALSIHVVDFSIGQGFQYHSLIQLLALRKSGKSKLVKITYVDLSVNHDKASSSAVGEKLAQIGNLAGIPVQFTSLNINLRDLTRESLHSNSDEVLVVNMAHTLYRIADESVSTDNPRDHLLRRVKGLKPRVATIVEQELNCNSSQLGSRLNECCTYYGALFDSLDSTLAKDNPERVNIEKEVSQKIMNSIACEGINRVERCEVYGKWRARMSMAGFQMKPLSQPITESVKNMVSSRGVNPNLSIKDENGGICFGWMGRTLIVVSSWC